MPTPFFEMNQNLANLVKYEAIWGWKGSPHDDCSIQIRRRWRQVIFMRLPLTIIQGSLISTFKGVVGVTFDAVGLNILIFIGLADTVIYTVLCGAFYSAILLNVAPAGWILGHELRGLNSRSPDNMLTSAPIMPPPLPLTGSAQDTLW